MNEHLAHFLFAREHVDVRILGKYGAAEDPYQIVLCTIPRKHRAGFLKAMEDLPELMSRMGKMDYDTFCRSVMLDAAQYSTTGSMTTEARRYMITLPAGFPLLTTIDSLNGGDGNAARNKETLSKGL